MIFFVATVDDGHMGILRHVLQINILQQPRHYAVDVAAEILCLITYVCKPEVCGSPVDKEPMPAELGHCDLEGHSCPCRSLLENHCQRLPSQRFPIPFRITLSL